MRRECSLFWRKFNKSKIAIMSSVTIIVSVCVYISLIGIITGSSVRLYGVAQDTDDDVIKFQPGRHHRNLQNSQTVDPAYRAQNGGNLKYNHDVNDGVIKEPLDEYHEEKFQKTQSLGNSFFVDDEDMLKSKSAKKQKNKNISDEKGKTKRLPQALIIGVKKAGTRALLEYLRMHPQVRAPGPEPHFFDKHYKKGLNWYRDLMPETRKGQITMEKTPSYFVTKGIPQRVYKMSKKTKLIIVFRDPVTRAISDYTQLAARNPSVKSFEEMLYVSNKTRIIDTSWAIVKIGIYAQHLVNWLQYFPIRQIHFVSGENLIEKPAQEMKRVQEFLGLEQYITAENFTFNRTKGFPCYRKTLDTQKWHCLNDEKGRLHTKIDESVKRRLEDFYRPFNNKLYSLTGIDFGWT